MRPSIGRIVLVRTMQWFNGSNVHPAMITRVWMDVDTETDVAMVNLQVLPDCAPPYCLTSVSLFDTPEQAMAGVGDTAFWPPRV